MLRPYIFITIITLKEFRSLLNSLFNQFHISLFHSRAFLFILYVRLAWALKNNTKDKINT